MAQATFTQGMTMHQLGKLVEAETGDQLDVINPATGQVVTRVPRASVGDVVV